ncbi:MAG TPA: preprotein translocase subunit SecE [Woeseiaceae bacterium]|nr:preprotein translocase subunit SecE [Woeseiaceae bacterium]
MSTHTETSQSGVLDILKLLVAAGALVAGLYGYYFYENDLALPLRVLMVLGGTAAGIAIAMTSAQGQRLWHFIQGSRVEIRKVVWPTRTETTQTAIAVFIFTLIMALFFWALDSGLLWLTRRLVG